ncbi:biotin--[acetyl-CoA-carboxylase] ligase [Mycetocola zhadangensis]|uniref:biotin--[biotin carboxyl-carrier protein] ligase n=1 Tax=Mycetocola zhadangensis TaxID=1164595 RepID=A0A3L7IWN1_9MICO|nr:biotin--[acetyl-CoA-carboxylase] ligase [Mycetocola zhadangensis]RLQ82505.1 biotin--[acetyl-CoA-carboxylase] ligase [Mycetocola zhadangensis]GGF00669.1 biotin--[acetyl-CoA-carboxylase] ligase [Mycetocola zhadangensis]
MTSSPADFPLASAVASTLDVLDSSPSTNDELVARAGRGPAEVPHFSVVVTDTQTAGRGRLGRQWTAPPGASLAISVLVRPGPSFPMDSLGWLPLAAGLAMSRAVHNALGGLATARVKWPNDVLVDGSKISGVLSELVDAETGAVVIGAGVNLTISDEDLPVPTATSLAVEGVSEPDRDRILADYLTELRSLTDALFSSRGDAAASGLQKAVTDSCSTVGARVKVELPGNLVLTGIARGIDSTGRIVVQADGSPDLTPVSAGDVTHLRTEPRA